MLVEKEAFGKKVEAIVDDDEPAEPLDNELAILRSAYHSQVESSEVQILNEERSEMRRHLVIAQKELELKEEKRDALQHILKERRANLAAARVAQVKREQIVSAELREKGIQLKAEHDMVHNKVIDAKAVLCRESALLLGLRHAKRKTKDGEIKDCYMIGQLPLPDLKDINSKFVLDHDLSHTERTTRCSLCRPHCGP